MGLMFLGTGIGRRVFLGLLGFLNHGLTVLVQDYLLAVQFQAVS